eukprot:3856821-Alexandrium_andersonii.AAC.1
MALAPPSASKPFQAFSGAAWRLPKAVVTPCFEASARVAGRATRKPSDAAHLGTRFSREARQ